MRRFNGVSLMKNINPDEDGKTHINIYSKGATKLGQDLTNFSFMPVMIPTYGLFNSIEGYWYYTKLRMLHREWTEAQMTSIKTLRNLHGYMAKKTGSELLKVVSEEEWNDFDEETFRGLIKEAIRLKIGSSYPLQKELSELTLPLVHYYTYGSGDKKVVREGSAQWIVDFIDRLRLELCFSFASAYIVRLYGEDSEVPLDAFCLGGKDLYQQAEGFILIYDYVKARGPKWTKEIEDDIIDFASKTNMALAELKDVTFFVQKYFIDGFGEAKKFISYKKYIIIQQNGIRLIENE